MLQHMKNSGVGFRPPPPPPSSLCTTVGVWLCVQGLINKQTQRNKLKGFREHFSHFTCCLEYKVLLLYMLHWSFIHVLNEISENAWFKHGLWFQVIWVCFYISTHIVHFRRKESTQKICRLFYRRIGVPLPKWLCFFGIRYILLRRL